MICSWYTVAAGGASKKVSSSLRGLSHRGTVQAHQSTNTQQQKYYQVSTWMVNVIAKHENPIL